MSRLFALRLRSTLKMRCAQFYFICDSFEYRKYRVRLCAREWKKVKAEPVLDIYGETIIKSLLIREIDAQKKFAIESRKSDCCHSSLSVCRPFPRSTINCLHAFVGGFIRLKRNLRETARKAAKVPTNASNDPQRMPCRAFFRFAPIHLQIFCCLVKCAFVVAFHDSQIF